MWHNNLEGFMTKHNFESFKIEIEYKCTETYDQKGRTKGFFMEKSQVTKFWYVADTKITMRYFWKKINRIAVNCHAQKLCFLSEGI